MHRLIIILIPLALFGSGVAGCLGTDEVSPCWQIPIPKEGSTVTYEQAFAPDWEPRSYNLSITEERILRADGHVEDAIALDWEFGERNFFSMNGTPLGIAMPALDVDFMSLDGLRLPPLLFGRCLTTGDQLKVPFRDGLRHINVEVVSHQPTLQVEMVVPDGQVSPFQGFSNKTYLWQLEWDGLEDPFPDHFEPVNRSKPDGGPGRTGGFTGYEGDTAREGVTEPIEPLALVMPSRPAGCEKLPGRHPDMGALPTHPRATFEAYRDNMSRDASLREYMDEHPQACASLVSYVTVNETSNKTTNYAPSPPEFTHTTSKAFVWTTIFADETGEQFTKRWVVRCYDDAILIVLYGECTDHPSYHQRDSAWEDGGRGQGPPINTSRIETEIGLGQVLENLERLTESEFKAFVWRTQVPAQPSRGVLQPRLGEEPGPAFMFSFEESRMAVEYVGPDGVQPGDGQTGGQKYIIFWQSGLAYTAQLVELRTP